MARNKNMIAFPWYGGKQIHLPHILPLLPDTLHYCEPFGGAGSILLNKRPVPIETFNDLDGDVVNFFRVLREQTEELLKAIHLTPYSREEFVSSITGLETLPPLERARLFFVKCRQGMNSTPITSPGSWSFSKLTTKRSISCSVSKYLAGVDGLEDVANRFKRVQIENRPAVDLIKACDTKETLFYVDPPYVFETRGRGSKKCYTHEMTNEQHEELAQVLNEVSGKVALSGYRCDLMDRFYSDWERIELRARAVNSSKSIKQECVWVNY